MNELSRKLADAFYVFMIILYWFGIIALSFGGLGYIAYIIMSHI